MKIKIPPKCRRFAYHRVLLYFLANDERVPEKVRLEMRRFGLPRDEFADTSQSAAAAACLAIDDKVGVQHVDYPQLRKRLLADGQVLAPAGAP